MNALSTRGKPPVDEVLIGTDFDRLAESEFHGKRHAVIDLFRIEQNKIVEHWDVIEEIARNTRGSTPGSSDRPPGSQSPPVRTARTKVSSWRPSLARH